MDNEEVERLARFADMCASEYPAGTIGREWHRRTAEILWSLIAEHTPSPDPASIHSPEGKTND
jgi:hypothetical protein